MRKSPFYATILSFLTVFSAQAAIDNISLLRLQALKGLNNIQLPDFESGLRADSADETEDDAAQDPYLPALLMIDDEATVDQLTAEGVIFYRQRDNIYLTAIPIDIVESVNENSGVISAEVCGAASANLNKAREMGRADVTDISAASPAFLYDGSGVVAGFSDIGFDNHHIAFRDKVAGIVHYNIARNEISRATTPVEISAWNMPVEDGQTGDLLSHATHVANIFAGNSSLNEYYGVARGSEIFATTSELSDVAILLGVEDVIDYAKSVGRPAVVNLSLSSTTGPHDGTDLRCRYLAACARDAAICISAGNEGARNISVRYSFPNAESCQQSVNLNTFNGWNGKNINGYVDLWCSSATPVKFRFEVYDINTYTNVYASEWLTSSGQLTLNSEDNPEWGKFLTGVITARASVSPLNNRYNITVYADTEFTEVASAGNWSRYYNVLTVAPADESSDNSTTATYPQSVDVFTDATLYLSVNPGSVAPGSTMSINDMATADGVIAVGACSSRNEAPTLAGTTQTWNFEVNNVASFSSYSDAEGIAQLPHFCAPGNYVVSAISTLYADELNDNQITTMATADGRNNYWAPMCGTSMASPFAAGVMALWLQANPKLTSAELIDIARQTARRDFADISNPRWGAGCIDAAAGLKYILKNSGVELPVLDAPLPLIEITGRRINITNPHHDDAAALYNISGARISLDSELAPGVYILDIPSHTPLKIHIP